MLNDENNEHFPEVLRERRRFYRETSKEQDFWVVPNPAFLDAAVQLGLTYWSLGRGEQALAEWRHVVEAEPTRRDAQMYLRLCALAPTPTNPAGG